MSDFLVYIAKTVVIITAVTVTAHVVQMCIIQSRLEKK